MFKNGCPGRDWFYEFKKRWRHKLGGLDESNLSRSQSGNAHPLNGEDEPTSSYHGLDETSSTRAELPDDSFSYSHLHRYQSHANQYFLNVLQRQYSLFDFSSHPENVWTFNEASLTLNCNFNDPSNVLFLKKPIKACQTVLKKFFNFLILIYYIKKINKIKQKRQLII